ncbi:Allergen Asp f 4 [Penicillium ucsense]|uniref:Allergen Asp f 4 n=1 Tax=Penicillium ucsense TaxID=2839758 RepID=A0A8J8VXI7_9EURO|nr:Allergen Asp f 4 [Penicillium ucsense]KAF7739052.1 Allergen Asp f 4 [Penicillium ucsense]
MRPRFIRPIAASEGPDASVSAWMKQTAPGPHVATSTFTTTVYTECQSTQAVNATKHITAHIIHVSNHNTSNEAVAPATSASGTTVIDFAIPSNISLAGIATTPLGSTQIVSPLIPTETLQQPPAHPTTIHIHKTTTATVFETVHPTVSTTISKSIAGEASVRTSSSINLPVSSITTALTTRASTVAAPNILSPVSDLPPIFGGIPQSSSSNLPVPNIPSIPSIISNPPLDVNLPSIPELLNWTTTPLNGIFTLEGFGQRTKPSGEHIQYRGNVGIPWGSNIIPVSSADAHRYKYVAQFRGSNSKPWTIVFWNKFGPEGKMDGWYGHTALKVVLPPGETQHIAFDENSEGAWGAAPGTTGLPVDTWGGYTSTWGEFSFGDGENKGWSGWDVSAIQAQMAKQDVQGMRICMPDGKGCSIVTPQARKVVDAYVADNRHHDGIGGAAAPGPVRLVVDIDYTE